MSKTFCRKFEGKKTCFLYFFSFVFLWRFFTVYLHEELKNTVQIFSKIKPKNLKKTPKK
jgi:hypothetical protein